jgi:sortase A
LGLVAIGLLLLTYVGAQYTRMYFEQRSLAKQWEQQQHRAVPSKEGRENSDGLTRITIPKIKLDAIIVEGTNGHDLLAGPGHITDTPQPGETGNAVVTAHRDTFFRHIYELTKGDVITIRRSGRSYQYQVTGKKIVLPDDISVLRPSRDKRLTLITCYPTYYIGPAPERLVIFSKMLEGSEGAHLRSASAGAGADPAR